MKEIKVLSFAKINLSIDVKEKMENGFHQVDMIMQQLSFHDDVTIRISRGEEFEISVKTSKYYLPTDERNLAYKAAALMIEEFGQSVEKSKIEINILKRIPVAAGLAGGSGNGAAVIHGLNALWNLDLSLSQILELCARLGSDVPFSAMGQARSNYNLPKKVRRDPLATSCARATGRGTILTPVKGIRRFIVLGKPRLGVSTPEVYKGIDNCIIENRPDNERLIRNLKERNPAMYSDFVNVLEEYTLKAYPKVKELKDQMKKTDGEMVLMSGSGPTVFGVYAKIEQAKEACQAMRDLNYEAYWTKTTR